MNEQRFARRLQNMEGSVIRELLKVTQQPEIISFAGGLPSPDSFPVEAVKEIVVDVLDERGSQVLQYGTTEGYQPLREVLADFVNRKRGFNVTADNILILSGSQQGIDLVSKAMLNPGDGVLVESPTYLAAVQVFKTYEAKFIVVPSDETGADLAALEQKLVEEKPKIVYMVPTFQNPSSSTMPLAKREKMAELLEKYEVLLVEDDPYGYLRYSGSDLPAISALDKSGQCVYLGSFSKIISPGLRVGYAVGPKDVLRKMIIGKQGTDLHTGVLSQAIIYEFFRRGLIEDHIDSIIEQYAAKRDLMLQAIEQHFPQEARWTRPDGGLFIWVELPEDIDTTELFHQTIKEKVAFVPGESFFADGSKKNCMRLNFSNASFSDIEVGIERLGKAIKSYIAKAKS